MSNPLLEYIVRKQEASNKHSLYNKIEIESLIGGIPIQDILSNIERSIPEYFFDGINKVIIGEFRDNKQNRSFYEDGTIYVSINNKENIERDICHELCHFLFEKYSFFEDVLVHDEFMGKRRRLFDILLYSGYNPPKELFVGSDFNQRFDDYLHKEIGYKKLTPYIIGLFPDPYSVTSLQEYVSTCFEFFFVKDRDYIRKICPATYKLLMHLIGKNGKLHFVLRT